MELKKIVMVASGCEPTALTHARKVAREDNRLMLIEEPIRRGKATAVNQIIERFEGEFLVLVNSDALPERGAIGKLLMLIAQNDDVGMVSASPVVDRNAGITGSVLQLMWGVHNQCLLELNHDDRNNHCCDELLAVRSEALRKLPPGTVNDGAFLAGAAYQAGYSIRFCEKARVRIDVPRSIYELMHQRRRIVYGHLQIWKSLGDSPRTLESMLLSDPRLSFSILIRTVAKSPRLMFALPVALVSEAVAITLGALDNLTSTKRHTKWERFGARS